MCGFWFYVLSYLKLTVDKELEDVLAIVRRAVVTVRSCGPIVAQLYCAVDHNRAIAVGSNDNGG